MASMAPGVKKSPDMTASLQFKKKNKEDAKLEDF